ncbi:MAG TPA: type IV secretion system DNA-binding domain-containing protein [Candidatus Paceibacterota bacterium]|nr:type IV secretion system DNA-binding domain-containing protein [Candidatus Paceibacterota bacterium]
MSWLPFAAGIGLGVILGVGIFFFVRATRRRHFFDSLNRAVFLIKIPNTQPEQGKDFKTEINTSEQLLANLAALKAPFALEVAVPHVGEEIHFFLTVPKRLSEVALKQVQGLWNGASVEQATDDFNIFNPQGATAAAYVGLKQHYALPVRTYTEVGADTFASVIGAFAKISQVGEGAALQLIVTPAPQKKREVLSYLEKLKKGEPLKKVLGVNEILAALPPAHELLSPKSAEQKAKEKSEPVIVDNEAVKALEAKITKPLFSVNVRFLASAPTPFQADDILDGLTAGLSQLAAPQRNEFKLVKPRNVGRLVHDYVFRDYASGQAMVLNTEEIASFWHLPTSSTETPKVKYLKSKEAAPPANLPADGQLLGQASFRGQLKPVYLTDEDKKRHIYIIGQTGTGKTTLIGNLIMSDMKRGKGIAVIDPHGDLVENALTYIPKERVDDLILFDPTDRERPLGLNMLDFNPNRPEEKTFIVNEMQSIFNKLFPPESMGPMFEQYMRNALLLLMEDMANEPATLIEVPRVFTDTQFRLRKLERIRNPVVADFWLKEAAKAGGEASLANMTPYITSKFNNFIANDFMRPIIGQPRSAFNFRTAMDEGKIILVNLSKGRLGDINANLLGMIVIGKILMAALSRGDIADKSARRDFNLYIDEFQNFSTDAVASILSEARKYALSLTMAHQFIAQLQDKIRDAVFGNVGSQIIMRVGAQDAEFLVKQLSGIFNEDDLTNIDNLYAVAKILINGQTAQPFSMKVGTESWTRGKQELAAALKEYSRQKYGADLQQVEQDIFARLRT